MAAAGAILIYVNMGAEVETREVIRDLLRKGKRIVVPYCQTWIESYGDRRSSRCRQGYRHRGVQIPGAPSGSPGISSTAAISNSSYVRVLHSTASAPGSAGARRYYDNFLRELEGPGTHHWTCIRLPGAGRTASLFLY